MPDSPSPANASGSAHGRGFSTAAAGVLTRAASLLATHADAAVEAFYAELLGAEDTAAVLARLSDTELDELKGRQAEHMVTLLDPERAEETVLASARRVGRVHALLGVEMDSYAQASRAYESAIVATCGVGLADPDRTLFGSVVTHRVLTDLRGAVRGYRDISEAGHGGAAALGARLPEVGTLSDLHRVVVDGLAELPGVVAAFLGRPGPDGQVVFEAGAGLGLEALQDAIAGADLPQISVRPDHPGGGGPVGRAWRSGQMERVDVYLHDPRTAPWAAMGERLGFRSMLALPLRAPHSEPQAVLALYSNWPGFFATPVRRAVFAMLRNQVEASWTRITSAAGHAPAVTGMPERAAHLAALAGGGVEMVFQPVVDLGTGRPETVEALARLRVGTRLLSPAEFLPSFGAGDLLDLFRVGLDQALTALRGWQSAGLHTGVSVNAPAAAATDRAYRAVVAEALARHGVDPWRVTIELVETDATLGEGPREGLLALKALGVRLAEDDLGSGYSSLLRLRTLPFDVVKIDRGLVGGSLGSPRATLGFIHPLALLAHHLEVRVVVEGLETPGLVEAAAYLGADAGQGFELAMPMPAEEVPVWARSASLRVNRDTPETALGALAAHMAWEARLSACVPGSQLWDRAVSEPCGLSAYVVRAGVDAARLRRQHEELHELARDVAGERPEAAWLSLADLLVGVD